MSTGTTKKRFTVDELARMDRAGIFTNERVELINGEVFLMTIGPRHAARVERARDIFNRLFTGKAAVRSQNPIRIDEYNLPQPDVVLTKIRPDYYESQHPRPEDIFLVLEVSDSTVEHDSELKLAVYAISRIREYWIEDISRDTLLVFEEPQGDRYTTCLTLRRGDVVCPSGFPQIKISVEDFFG